MAMRLSYLVFSLFTLFILFSFTQNPSFDIKDHDRQEGVEADTVSLYERIYQAEEVVIGMSSKIKEITSNFKKGNATEGSISVSVDGKTFDFSTSFELGGKTRRKVCRMPPIKLNIKKKELDSLGFSRELDKAKIVFQCKSGKSMAATIKMEKLIYDLHAVVSPYARRAKMIKVKIHEEKKEYDAFLLEDDDDFEVRTQTKILKNKTVGTNVLNREEYVKMCMFQYMISNADWSARKGHNTDLYKRIEDNALIIVPYDFDYSGIINNVYAVAPENLPIDRVTQRYFMDKNVTMEEMKKCISHFLEKESQMFATIEDSAFLSDGSKKRLTKFISEFYKIIRNEKKVKRMIKS